MAADTSLELAEWIEQHEATAKYDLASHNASPLSIDGLLAISEQRDKSQQTLSLAGLALSDIDTQLSAGDTLKDNLSALYSARSAGVNRENIVITNGASAALYTALSALLERGDHVVCQHPANELLYKIPTVLGADVSLWRAEPGKKWQLDIDELAKLVQNNTKVIIMNNPCDPTGAIVPKPTLDKLVDFAEEKKIIILADETSRPLFHSILPSSDDFPPSTINLGYRKAVVIGSVSRAYSIPGIKAGWIASRDREIVGACKRRARLASASVSKLDQIVAAEALSDRCIHALLARNIKMSQTNLDTLQAFIEEHNWACSWVRPVAGVTALIRFHKMGKPVDDEAFCSALLSRKAILTIPASKCFGDGSDLRGYVRVAFAASSDDFKAAMQAWKDFMEESFDTVPTILPTTTNKR